MFHSGIVRPFPPGPLVRSIDEVEPGLTPEAIVPVRTARVVVANYHAILHDFPGAFGPAFLDRYEAHFCPRCREQGSLCSHALDRWILDNAAYISLAQAQPNAVNSPVEHGPAELRGYRPFDYGRALVVEVSGPRSEADAGFMDIKGAGVAPGLSPSHEEYKNGLEYVGVALADYFISWLVDRIFRRTVPGYQTVPVYAVIDLGFDLLDDWHGTAPAGLHVRRAHVREERALQLPVSGSDGERVRLHMELILRTYGMTTASRTKGFRLLREGGETKVLYDGKVIVPTSEREQRSLEQLASVLDEGLLEHTNMQLTAGASWEPRSAQIVDFGHVHVRDRFRNPLATTARDTHHRVGRIIRPGEPAYVQPSPQLALDPDLFMRTSINSLSFYLAQAFRCGQIRPSHIRMAMRKALRKSRV